MDSDTAGVLPLHRGTILLPMNNLPRLVTKHKDGELIALANGPEGHGIDRRHEYDAEWRPDGGYKHYPTAIATLADRQGFGYRNDGNAATMTTVEDHPQTVEIEPLHLGCILFQNASHFPFGIYLDTAETYRLQTREASDHPDYYDGADIGMIEYRPDNRSEFELIAEAPATQAHDLARLLAEECPVEVLTTPSRDNINSVIDKQFNEEEVLKHGGNKPEVMEQVRLQDKTAIPPDTPAPAPLFPNPQPMKIQDDIGE